MELKVRMLNINIGYNQTIMEQCRILSEYMQYVDIVRKYAAVMPTPMAVDHAVTECIKKGILAVFLQKYRQEAIQTLVEVCQEVGRSLVDTVETVVSKFGLDEAESRAKVEKYWK